MGNRSLLSFTYIVQAKINCLLLLMQAAATALALARFKAGNSIAARIAIMAMTTSNSIRVKAARGNECGRLRTEVVMCAHYQAAAAFRLAPRIYGSGGI